MLGVDGARGDDNACKDRGREWLLKMDLHRRMDTVI